MRVNVYAEEITDRVELVVKGKFVGLRFYLELPVTQHMEDGRGYTQHRGPFMHHLDDDDSAAVTFWGKRDMLPNLEKARELLNLFRHRVEVAGDSPAKAAKFANLGVNKGIVPYE